MRYTVVYDKIALDALIRYWMAALDQPAVEKASNEIDRLLKLSPETCGEPFGPFLHLKVGPLDVMYLVSPDDRIVRVFTVRFVS